LVVDTSALLAIFFQESFGPWVSAKLDENQPNLGLSVVNFTELLILVGDREPTRVQNVRRLVETSSVELVPVSIEQAEIAAGARLRYPLNLGDCFAYALAKDRGAPLLTLDRDFGNCDIEVVLPRVH